MTIRRDPPPAVPLAAAQQVLGPVLPIPPAQAGVPPVPGDIASTRGPADVPPPWSLADETETVAEALYPTEEAAFRKLPQAERLAFVDIFQALSEGGEGADQARHALGHLLTSGKGKAKDSLGHSLFSQLQRFLQVPLDLPDDFQGQAAGYRLAQLEVLLNQIAHPTTINQGNHETCAATSAQLDLASNFPGQYAAFAIGLLSHDQSGLLPGGIRLARSPESLHPGPNDPRPAVSRMIQAAFMRVANGGHYSDHNKGQAADPFGAAEVHQQLRGELVSFLVDDRWDTRGIKGFIKGVSHDSLFKAIERDLGRQKARGRKQPLVPVALRWGSGSGHQVLVTQTTADRVYFINPDRDQFATMSGKPTSKKGVETEGPKKRMTYYEGSYPFAGPGPIRVYADGTQSLSRSQFDDEMFGAAVATVLANCYKQRDRFTSPF